MARRRDSYGHRASSPRREDHLALLQRRARRLAGQGRHRKAALALRELAALHGDAASYAMLGHMLLRASRHGEALDALRQALWLHRRAGAQRRARTVARMIVALDPLDARARRLADVAA